MPPLSKLKRLLAHLSNHLLPDNKLSDHRHTQTDKVLCTYEYKISMTPIPRNKFFWYVLIANFPPLISYSFISHMHETRSWDFTVLPRTIPFVVQPYEPILLIVQPHRLLVCGKTSKPSQLGPWHARNHHTMDSSPNSSRRE